MLAGGKKAKRRIEQEDHDDDDDDDNDESDVPLPAVRVKPTTQEFYEQHKEEVCACYLFDSLVRWMCGVKLKDRVSNKELRERLGILRKMIRMVDEQEGCEWMHVSSGTGSPV